MSPPSTAAGRPPPRRETIPTDWRPLLRPVASVALVLGAAWCLGALGDGRALPDAAAVTKEDLRVYSAVLAWQEWRNPLMGPLVVQREIEKPLLWIDPLPTERQLFHQLAAELPGLRRETVHAFMGRGEKTGRIDVPLLPGVPLTWTTRERARAHPWRSKHPGPAFWYLSPVGYDRPHDQALVHLDYACPLCAVGRYVLLRRGAQGWHVTAQFADSFS